MGDEYTDYSCSTPLERLSRDVESILRAWHVDQGCDRHVSLLNGAGIGIGVGAGDGLTHNSNSNLNSNSNSANVYEEDPTCPLIRSNTLTWNVPVTTSEGRSTVTVDLELALWDSPTTGHAYGYGYGYGHGGLADLSQFHPPESSTTAPRYEEQSTLVHSLQERRRQAQLSDYGGGGSSNNNSNNNTGNSKMPSHDYLFDNFATLFGIGQHISLSPIQPHPMPIDLLQAMGGSLLERHSDSSTVAPFVLGSTLSGWLQSALNCATSNVQCAIPAFGVWGVYRPNELPKPQNVNPHMMISSSQSHSRNNGKILRTGTDGSTTYNHTTTTGDISSTGGIVGPAANAMDQLVGTTIQTKDKVGTMPSSSSSVAESSSALPTTTNNKRRPVRGIPVFPRWATAFREASLPTIPRAYRRKAFHWNHQYVPPLICSRVTNNIGKTSIPPPSSLLSSSTKTTSGNANGDDHNDHDDYTPCTATTMWVSATHQLPSHPGLPDSNANANGNSNANNSSSKTQNSNNKHHALAASNRLSIWGSVLLQHCAEENEETSCILHGARHVFGWIKVSPEEAPKHLLFGKSNIHFLASLQEWRRMNIALNSTPKPGDSEFHLYQKHCQAHAMDLLEDAWKNHQYSNRSTKSKFQADALPALDYYEYRQSVAKGGGGRRGASASSSTNAAALEEPLWGPLDDPVASIYATTTWNGKATTPGTIEPLITFPLRIRSAQPVTKRDWMDMEDSVERSVLDPLSPSRFSIQVFYDRETSTTPLAANQRCVLAALIRSATLPGETLLSHLTDRSLVELWDDDAGTIVASKLASKSKCGSATTTIVKAMDWSSIMEDMISTEQATDIVHAVMRGELSAGFPSSVDDSFLATDDVCRPFVKAAPFGRLLSLLFAHLAKLRALSSISVVWNVFCQELRRRWDARESLPNMQYVAGLDPHPLQLYKKRSFTTIGHRANFSAFLNCSEPDPDDYHCLIGQKLQVFQVGVECIVANEMLEHEAMERFLEQGVIPTSAKVDHPPDLVRSDDPSEEDEITAEQKNQWQPVGGDKVKSILPNSDVQNGDKKPAADPTSSSKRKKRKWPKSKSRSTFDENGERKDYGPPTINSDLEFWVMDEPGYAPRDAEGVDLSQPTTDDTGFDFVVSAPKDLEDLDTDESVSFAVRKQSQKNGPIDLSGWEGTIMEGQDSDSDAEEDESEGSDDSAASMTTSGSLSQAYFDAAEAGSIFSTKHGFVTLDTVVNVADMNRRPGARCPVDKVTLRATGDQLYAPYLQRPGPLTDDLVMERKHMLASEQREGESRKAVLEARIQLAHRLQRPKLMSDMSAFKAANPNSTIDDFTRWYGNPGSPLDDYDEPMPDDSSVSVSGAYFESAAKKLDRASEAMKVLVATRDFWASTWEQAPAAPASEQTPLFDHESTVEMALDYLEQMHPANLVNQVMAVNLSSAFFALITSAEDALKVGLFRSTTRRLRRKIEHALEVLSKDTTGALFNGNVNDAASTSTATANQYISEESIYACEEACNALSVTETMLSRTISLLSKFPSQYRLVEELLRLSDGTPVSLTDRIGRKGFLEAIYQQQKEHGGDLIRQNGLSETIPQPIIREYVLRNLDDDKPCQLAVRFGDSGAYLGRVENDGGVLLAITKSYTD